MGEREGFAEPGARCLNARRSEAQPAAFNYGEAITVTALDCWGRNTCEICRRYTAINEVSVIAQMIAFMESVV